MASPSATTTTTTTADDVAAQVHNLKRQALACKKAGDVQGALQLLAQAKQVQAQHQQQQQQQAQQQQEEKDTEEKKQQPNPPQQPVTSGTQKDPTEQPAAKDTNVDKAAKEEERDDIAEEQVDDDDDDLLKGLQQGEDGNDDMDLIDFDETAITFSDAEMLDSEMMTEFKLGGMPVPTDDDYRAKILASKRAALASKNAGNIAQAKEELQRAKQFESVRVALSHMQEGLGLRIHDDDDGWLEELNEQDSETIGQVLSSSNNNITSAGGGAGGAAMTLDLDDLDDMSPQEIADAVEMGMELPAVEEVMAQANEKKALALEHKQAGNMDGAKAALLEFKKLQTGAQTLQTIVQNMERRKAKQDGGEGEEEAEAEVSMEALESLLDGENNNKKAPPKATTQPQPQQAKQPQPPVVDTRTAEELKQEAVRLRNEKNMKEATQVFKLYKEALQREADAAERKVRRDMVDSLRAEIQKAQQQQRLFQYYQRFVDTKVGTAQLSGWKDYAQKCANVARMIELKGSKSVIITRQQLTTTTDKDNNDNDNGPLMFLAEDQLVNVMQRGVADAADERLEVGVLTVNNIHENKAFQKVMRQNGKKQQQHQHHILRVDVTMQIPPSESERDKSVELVLESSLTPNTPDEKNNNKFEYSFKESHHVDVPRGDSKFAETVLRRMERRKMNLTVYHVPREEKTKKWFGWSSGGGSSAPSSSDKDEKNAPTLLGKVVLELRDLLDTNCIAGGFPLMRNTNTVGGTLELVVRTGAPLVVDKKQDEGGAEDDEFVSAGGGEEAVVGMAPYEAMSFSIPMEKK